VIGSRLRKSLGQEFQEIEPWLSFDDLARQNKDAYLNIDHILASEQTRIKVLILLPIGKTTVAHICKHNKHFCKRNTV